MAKPKTQKGRASEIEVGSRILLIAKAILNGYSKRVYLLQFVAEKYDWGVSTRQIDNYILKAKNIIRNSFSEEDLGLEKDIAIDRLEALFTMNMKIQDYREARNVTIDRMKLIGLYVEKKDITSDNKEIKGITFIE